MVLTSAAPAPSSESGSILVAMLQYGSATRPSAHLTPDARVFVQTLEAASRAVGSAILAASDDDELGARFDDAVASREFAYWLNKTVEAASRVTSPVIFQGLPPRALSHLDAFLGRDDQRFVRELERLLDALLDAHAQLQRVLTHLAVAAGYEIPVRHRIDEDSPLAFLSDPRIPPVLAETMLGTLMGNVAFLAVHHAYTTEAVPPSWWTLSTLARWTDGVRKNLVLLASFPFINVAPSVVALEERLDIARLERENEQAQAAVERFFTDANESGQDVYAPEPRE